MRKEAEFLAVGKACQACILTFHSPEFPADIAVASHFYCRRFEGTGIALCCLLPFISEEQHRKIARDVLPAIRETLATKQFVQMVPRKKKGGGGGGGGGGRAGV